MPLTMRSQPTLPSTAPEAGTQPLYSLAGSNVLVSTDALPHEIGQARLDGTQITVWSAETGKQWRVAARRIQPLS